MIPDAAFAALRRYPLLDALRERRSRRFGLGMAMPAGPFAHRSRQAGLRLPMCPPEAPCWIGAPRDRPGRDVTERHRRA